VLDSSANGFDFGVVGGSAAEGAFVVPIDAAATIPFSPAVVRIVQRPWSAAAPWASTYWQDFTLESGAKDGGKGYPEFPKS